MDPTQVVDFLNKLGTLSPQGLENFNILVAHERFAALATFIVLGILFVTSIPFMVIGTVAKIHNDENWSNDWTLAGSVFIFGAILLILCVAWVLFFVPSAITNYNNPEYQVLKFLYNSTIEKPPTPVLLP